MKQAKDHLQLIDYVRGFAILGVFVFHCVGVAFGHDQLYWNGQFKDFSCSSQFLAILPATWGWAGVAIFFVVSGFCIHLSFIRGTLNDWRGFWVRRFFRIYPPYFLALIFFAFVFPLSRVPVGTLYGWAQFGSHALLAHNFDTRTFFGINVAFWSISVEVQLYLLYPLLIALVGKIGWHRALFILGIVEVSFRALAGGVFATTGHEVPIWVIGLPFGYWFSWAIGAAIADALVKKRPMPFCSVPSIVWLLLAIGSIYAKVSYQFSFMFFAVFTAAVIARQLESDRAIPVPHFILTHLRSLGICSYSFYLLHEPLIETVPLFFKRFAHMPNHPIVLYGACLLTYPFILLVSWLYYKHCEMRSIGLGKLFLPRTGKRI
jgi:peptidoglycan/LPS O-acetylase OafA/YrhL